MAMRNENMDKRQNYVTWVEIALQFTKKLCKVDIAKDVETRFDTSNYELERLLPRRKTRNKQLFNKL